MKPNQLRAFVAVVEHAGIRAAARALGLSQPAVTKIVRELESDMGAPLVERSVQGVRLTAFGQAFAPRARLLLADMQRARDEIVQLRDGAASSLSLAVSTGFALSLLPEVFRQFHARLPAVEVRFGESVLARMLAQLRDGSLDFAVAPVVPETLDGRFEALPLFPAPFVIGLRHRHPLRAARSLRELHAAEWILPDDDPQVRGLASALFSPLGLPAPARIVACQSATVALQLAGHMDLVGIFVEPLARLMFRRHGLRCARVADAQPVLHMCVLRRCGQASTPAARQFIECIQRVASAGVPV